MEGERITLRSRVTRIFRTLSTPIEPSRGLSPIDRFERATRRHDQRGNLLFDAKLSDSLKEHYGITNVESTVDLEGDPARTMELPEELKDLSKPALHYHDSVGQF